MAKRIITSFILALVVAALSGISVSAYVPASAVAVTSSPIAPFTSDNAIVDYLQEYNPIARGTSAPAYSDVHNLSSNDYGLKGEFIYAAYTDKCFFADGLGKMQFSITINYQDTVVPYHMRKVLTVELYRIDAGSDTLIDSWTVQADLYPGYTDMYYDDVTCSRLVSGLGIDENVHYYFKLIKTNDGLDASISGYIGHSR